MSPDPVAGGSATAYDYCNADPVNCTDLGGTFSFTGLLSAVAVVGEIASLIPGPVGAAAAGISAVAYAVQGNTAKAIEMGVSAAAALVGAGAVVRVAARAVGSAAKAGQLAARAAPRVARTVSQQAVRAAPETGIYIVNSSRGVYVGQSKHISRRLTEHVRNGTFTRQEAAMAARQSVQGGRTQREIAEQLMLDRIGRVGDPGILNRVNPIGPRRFHLMPNQPYAR